MNRSIRLLIALAICSLPLGVMSGCSKVQKAPPQRPPVSVKTAPVIQEEVPVVIDTFGNTKDMASI
ncbi:MAG: efflux RND transporter periplasmic adaptor subunit, partial [Lentisphaerota bacterium]